MVISPYNPRTTEIASLIGKLERCATLRIFTLPLMGIRKKFLESGIVCEYRGFKIRVEDLRRNPIHFKCPKRNHVTGHWEAIAENAEEKFRYIAENVRSAIFGVQMDLCINLSRKKFEYEESERMKREECLPKCPHCLRSLTGSQVAAMMGFLGRGPKKARPSEVVRRAALARWNRHKNVVDAKQLEDSR